MLKSIVYTFPEFPVKLQFIVVPALKEYYVIRVFTFARKRDAMDDYVLARLS